MMEPTFLLALKNIQHHVMVQLILLITSLVSQFMVIALILSIVLKGFRSQNKQTN